MSGTQFHRGWFKPGDRPSTTVLGPVHGSREPTPAASLTQFWLAYCLGHLSSS
ncbi:hypothetical protein CPAR01_08502 [Colletotrichum paranaense]|nr:uncharacterized protein CCOS01_00900 [Colletotrichum costaricense]XP_060349140.1 uncharacterized protein CPAR01_08502 [Colletotrichum paranaense]XP_060385112.1 uncharacterized protein CTAM01_04437 [Colletotrichum tamarilloi]KAI3529739.1 hypothetical protein CABS02_14730 [Colletotrichum abscissum]KAK0367877.1 hypothetical protein CLIM01_14766 [Colletotrichum limetticola]KAK1504207.1 hypothetical protein CTAM01_04437 [Colletotrichum tamarilloi]KAK1538389.1 hypothetical protein CPAR01_08502 [